MWSVISGEMWVIHFLVSVISNRGGKPKLLGLHGDLPPIHSLSGTF